MRQTERPLQVAMIVGSTREGRFGPTVASWAAEQIGGRDDVVLDVVDLGEADLPAGVDAATPATRDLAGRLAAADAVVVVTPEYNHSFPGDLKNAIDRHHDEWTAKPVGHVSYGGLAGGLRAVEALRLVFEELHAVSMRTSVAFPTYWDLLDADGALAEAKPQEGAIAEMVDQLVWWGDALRRQRESVPYPGGDE